MKPKDIFSLAIRILGLVFLYHGLSILPMMLSGGFRNLLMAIIMIGWPLLVAYWLLRGAPLLMRLAYPDTPSANKNETPTGETLGLKADA